MTKILIDRSHHHSTVHLQREPTAIEIAQNVIEKLKADLCDLQSHNWHLEEMLGYWKAEASKQGEYVELARYRIKDLRNELENVNARIEDLEDKLINATNLQRNGVLEKESASLKKDRA
ncbi:hypothetical protein HWV62_28282 [Athelia sp. TMB]|nr:hypothetical protein HWV62_28282 [Athelia sp. TMB]